MSRAQARVLLIGLDGATFTILDPLMQRGVMPFLREFSARAARAPLRTVTPALTPPGWTSMMTGKRPGQHGVFDFFQKDSPDREYFRLSSYDDIHSETIWSLASAAGRRVIALNFPMTFPPPDVNGFVVPGGWMPWRQLRLGCHPADLFDRLKVLPSFNARELAMDMALEEKALEGCATEEYGDWIRLHTRRELRWADILEYLLQAEDADLVGVVFDGVDKLQHLCWRFLDPACQPAEPSAWEAEIIRLCEGYFRQLDEILAHIVEQAGPHATVVFASDHGAGPTSDVFFLNTWLEQHGYLVWNDSTDIEPVSGTQIGMGQITRHVYQLDWGRTVAYAATPSSFGLHLTVGQPKAELLRLRTDLAAALMTVLNPATGRPIVERAVTREEAFGAPYAELGPDLSLDLADGAVMSILRSSAVIQRRPEPRGSHRPLGIFLADGPGIRAGHTEELSILDVAPLLLHRLGLAVPDDLAGRVPTSVFDPSELRRAPPRQAVATGGQGATAATASEALDAEAEAIVLRRLRALGYVE